MASRKKPTPQPETTETTTPDAAQAEAFNDGLESVAPEMVDGLVPADEMEPRLVPADEIAGETGSGECVDHSTFNSAMDEAIALVQAHADEHRGHGGVCADLIEKLQAAKR